MRGCLTGGRCHCPFVAEVRIATRSVAARLLAKTSEATSNTVTWSFMAFLNAKFRERSESFERRGPTVIQLLLQELSGLRASKTPGYRPSR
jgi:hypothetical protein